MVGWEAGGRRQEAGARASKVTAVRLLHKLVAPAECMGLSMVQCVVLRLTRQKAVASRFVQQPTMSPEDSTFAWYKRCCCEDARAMRLVRVAGTQHAGVSLGAPRQLQVARRQSLESLF